MLPNSTSAAGTRARFSPARSERASSPSLPTPAQEFDAKKRLMGLEPTTFCMASRRSSQLSYSRTGAILLCDGRGGVSAPATLAPRLAAESRVPLLPGLSEPSQRRCSSARSSTRTSVAPPTWSPTANAGVAAVVDPQWDIDPYLRLARLHGVRIEPRAGDPQPRRPRLRARPAGAGDRRRRSTSTSWPGPSTRTSRSPTAGSWSWATVTIEAVHTPGHRPEHTSFLLRRREPRRRALGAARRRLAVRRRRRPPRPGGRAARGRRRRCSARCTSGC